MSKKLNTGKKQAVKCWEVFKCEKADCPAYKSRNLKCWLFSRTHCRDEIQGKFLEKMELCLGCKVFKRTEDIKAMKATLEVANKQYKEFTRIIRERDKELENMSMELAISLSEVFEALKKISSGDPSVRISELSDVELISKLKHLVNSTAEEIGQIVDLSHEIAIGLTEHFDILHKVSRGNLEARVTGKSKIDMLESLKIVTNQMIANISKEMAERTETEATLRKRTYDLWERIKELNCLYGITDLIETEGITIHEMLEKIVTQIPFGWQYPEVACARITVNNLVFQTDNFQETEWKQASDIVANSKKVGKIELYYLEEQPEGYEGPFQKEERDLINAIAGHVGRFLERIDNEEKIRESEEKYRTVFENTGNATIIVEEDTIISLVNTKFENLSGYTKEEIEGKKSWKEFFDVNDIERMNKYHYERRVEPHDVPANYEVNFIDRYGNTRNILLNISLIPGTKRTVETLLDITEKKKLEEQMFHTEKLASIGTLAAGIAHEINNPLAIILGFTDLILEKANQDSEFHDLLLTIQKHGTNAKRIVENLLSFVRYKEHHEEDVNINRIVEEVIALKGNAFLLNNITVKRDMAESLPSLRGNAGELQQVLFNIVNNAIAAMKGGGTLTIGTKQVEVDGKRNIEITVSDTGTGIKPEHRTRIFDPLFTTKKVGEGTGLGLTVSYAIVKKYAGELDFDTRTKDETEESGTTFRITFPENSLSHELY